MNPLIENQLEQEDGTLEGVDAGATQDVGFDWTLELFARARALLGVAAFVMCRSCIGSIEHVETTHRDE